ncbi:unnamed protein product [Larinioides sclopetarius]|uniref:Uncharacterized protein n=1 Tax=Larinioides sclopetarius TaxID=280406 RepID=A0AAV2BHQ4_9ARAC
MASNIDISDLAPQKPLIANTKYAKSNFAKSKLANSKIAKSKDMERKKSIRKVTRPPSIGAIRPVESYVRDVKELRKEPSGVGELTPNSGVIPNKELHLYTKEEFAHYDRMQQLRDRRRGLTDLQMEINKIMREMVHECSKYCAANKDKFNVEKSDDGGQSDALTSGFAQEHDTDSLNMEEAVEGTLVPPLESLHPQSDVDSVNLSTDSEDTVVEMIPGTPQRGTHCKLDYLKDTKSSDSPMSGQEEDSKKSRRSRWRKRKRQTGVAKDSPPSGVDYCVEDSPVVPRNFGFREDSHGTVPSTPLQVTSISATEMLKELTETFRAYPAPQEVQTGVLDLLTRLVNKVDTMEQQLSHFKEQSNTNANPKSTCEKCQQELSREQPQTLPETTEPAQQFKSFISNQPPFTYARIARGNVPIQPLQQIEQGNSSKEIVKAEKPPKVVQRRPNLPALIVKPVGESSTATENIKEQLESSISPRALGVQVISCREAAGKGLIIKVQTPDMVQKLQDAINTHETLSTFLKAREPFKRLPHILIYDVPKSSNSREEEEEDFLTKLRQSNRLPEGTLSYFSTPRERKHSALGDFGRL